MMISPSVEQCIEVAARGIAFTRAFARPYIAEKIREAWWLHDRAPHRTRERNQEWLASGEIESVQLDTWARERETRRFIISAVAKDDREQAELLAKYKSLGYRLWRTETIMARSTGCEGSRGISAHIHFVDTEEAAARLSKSARGKMVLSEHLVQRPIPVRCHIATVDDQLAGWVRSISIGTSSWCASLYVEPKFRRCGIGRNLVATMLQADRAAGTTTSILIASHAGANLYQSIGYDRVGTVLVLNPQRK